MSALPKVDIDQPKFDQSTYVGRCKHFFLLTNPLNLLASDAKLERAQRIVKNYRAGKDVSNDVSSLDELWRAKYVYDSAFHPETGEKSPLIGRMSAQMPMNTIITGCMLSFHKSTGAVVFWQWFNQTFNAIVNYTNRSGTSKLTTGDILKSYCLATGGALVTALSLKRLTANMPALMGRLVPFVAISAANCINVPMMRLREILNGVVLLNDQGREVGASKRAAITGIALVVLSRISMAIPGMTFTPFLMDKLDKPGKLLNRKPWLSPPLQTVMCGLLLIFATPMGCALWPQKMSLRVERLESEVQEDLRKRYPDLKVVWFNKGL
uniref:Sidoreflexin n=1 Tax=Ceratitis capitata TaxID=7213 RepID=W8C293_CERCA